jgi:hypothetical protein
MYKKLPFSHRRSVIVLLELSKAGSFEPDSAMIWATPVYLDSFMRGRSSLMCGHPATASAYPLCAEAV